MKTYQVIWSLFSIAFPYSDVHMYYNVRHCTDLLGSTSSYRKVKVAKTETMLWLNIAWRVTITYIICYNSLLMQDEMPGMKYMWAVYTKCSKLSSLWCLRSIRAISGYYNHFTVVSAHLDTWSTMATLALCTDFNIDKRLRQIKTLISISLKSFIWKIQLGRGKCSEPH